MNGTIEIDGSHGEGGGQILRSSLALSIATGKSLRMKNIRAGRRKPGLLRQHLTAVEAAARVGAARVEGNTLGSRDLEFQPGALQSGEFRFAVGTAGSATLVLQTVLPVLLAADGPSEIHIEGGTHNPMAPPYDFLAGSFLPVLSRMGAKISARLLRAGYFPAGGGAAVFRVEPLREKRGLKLLEPGEFRGGRGRILLSGLPNEIGEREARQIQRKMHWPATIERPPSPGPGNALLLEVEFDRVTQVFAGFGEKGKPGKAVVDAVCRRAKRCMETGAAACEYLADQLLLPMVLFGGGSFTTETISLHTRTNIEVIQTFLDVAIDATEEDKRWRVDVQTRN